MLLVYLDREGYLLHTEKSIRYQSFHPHEWKMWLQKVHFLPESKKAEIHDQYREIPFQVLHGACLHWKVSELEPQLTCFSSLTTLLSAMQTHPTLFDLVAEPHLRKRSAIVVFVQPSKETIRSMESKERKHQLRLKSVMRRPGGGVASSSSFQSRKPKRVEIFGTRDPLNKELESEWMARKRARKTSLH
jgi:hypothetical protein